jgi:hypothetical protein
MSSMYWQRRRPKTTLAGTVLQAAGLSVLALSAGITAFAYRREIVDETGRILKDFAREAANTIDELRREMDKAELRKSLGGWAE